MIDRMTLGRVPPKHHRILRLEPAERQGSPAPGALHGDDAIAYEHCFTRMGFDDAYTILYHRHSPAREQTTRTSERTWHSATPVPLEPLRRVHVESTKFDADGDWIASRVPLLVNEDAVVSVARPTKDDPGFFVNADGDELLFFFRGGALLETPFGEQTVAPLEYCLIPRGTPYRLTFAGRRPSETGTQIGSADGPDADRHHILIMEAKGGVHVPKQFRNPAGQLTFDAPYSHRDFGRPTRLVDVDGDAQETRDGPWLITVKKDDRLTERVVDTHPCDIVGWDGYVYPITFNILDYQPKTGKYHLPPTIHITFGMRGAVVCSFVPRKVDYGEDAIPCPYPHSSVDCDEMLFYVRGHFTSRKGVGPGSISLHPAGLPHAPQPGSYERSIGTTETDEVAVMMDTFKPLRPTRWALDAEDGGYMDTWSPERFDAARRASGGTSTPEPTSGTDADDTEASDTEGVSYSQ